MADYCIVGHLIGVSTQEWLLDVIDWEPDVETPVEVIDGTLDGARGISFGIAKRVWRFTALVHYTSPPSGYPTLAEVQSWFTETGTAQNIIEFTPLEGGGAIDSILANKGEFRPRTDNAAPFAAGAIWKVPFEVMEA